MPPVTAQRPASDLVIPPDATTQLSYSGTPRDTRGWTFPDEYVRELQEPRRRMERFEEMGSSDDAVHTALDARRQETCSANWHLSSDDETPAGREVLEFVEDNIYPFIDDLLRWLVGGAHQYGFGAVEPVYAWSDQPLVAALARGKVRRSTIGGKRRIYLRRLAHIRQRVVLSFVIAPTGELQTIHQFAFNGVTWLRVDIPADKLLLWTYNRQGDDYWGVPPTRHCYKAWTFKAQLERLNVLSFDRFGVGIPVATEPQGGYSPLERTRLETYLKAFRSGDSGFVIHPYGGTIEILSGDGKMTMTALEWVKYYNFAIAKVFLTQQTELGSTETGARAVAETFYEQLGSIVQADCEELATLINNKLIVPLVNMNFGPQDTYPSFAPSQRVRAGSGVATVVAQLINAGVLFPRPEDEGYFRDVFELPAVDIATLRTEQAERSAKADAAGGGGGTVPAPHRLQPPGGGVDGSFRATRRAIRELAGDLATGAPDPAILGKSTWRTPDYSSWEHGVLRPDSLLQELYLQQARLAGEVQDVLHAIDADLATQVAALASDSAAALSDGVKSIAVPAALRTQLQQVMLAAAIRARAFGGVAVRNELERQIAPGAIGPQRAPVVYPSDYGVDATVAIRALAAADAPTPGDLHLQAEVDRAVANEIDRREQAARSGALTALAQAAGATAAVLASVATTATKAGLVGLSTGRTQDNVQSVVNVGFGIGRSDAARAIADGADGGDGNRSGLVRADGSPIELQSKVYSAVMDDYTCPECAKWDGAEFPIGYPEDYTGVQAPNPRCEGTYAKCRCVWIYATDRESIPLVPASKGPLPIDRRTGGIAAAAVDGTVVADVERRITALIAANHTTDTKTLELMANIVASVKELAARPPAPISLTIEEGAIAVQPVPVHVTIEAAAAGKRVVTETRDAAGNRRFEMSQEP